MGKSALAVICFVSPCRKRLSLEIVALVGCCCAEVGSTILINIFAIEDIRSQSAK